MVEIFGMMMYESTYAQMVMQAHAQWDAMDEWDREFYEDYEDFEDSFFHFHLYSEE